MHDVRVWIVALGIGLSAAGAARAQPELAGPLAVTSWDAGSVDAAGASLPTRVYYPADGGGPYPVVGVIHGASRSGTNMQTMAGTLASYGFVAVVPTIPCNFLGCNHDANAAQLSALLDWAVDQGTTDGSPIAGLVDGARRGLIGHSWGGLASHLAAARDDRIAALVLLDPNDDGTVGVDATSTIRAATLQLLADHRGACDNQWQPAAVAAALSGPEQRLTLVGSAHCDPEDPTDGLCAIACGSGDRATTPYFRRYAVAWMACALAADREAAPWVAGAGIDDDLGAGLIRDVAGGGLDALACLEAGADADAGAEDAGADAAADAADAAADDAPGADAAPDVAAGDADGADAGRMAGRGCGCRVAAGPGAADTWSAAAVLLVALRAVRRRRRRR